MTKRLASDINVTPLIDVLLVILVIFLLTLPLTQEGFDADIPPAVAAPHDAAPPSQLVAQFDANRRLTLNQEPLDLKAFEQKLRDVLRTRHDKALYVIGDGSVRYGEITQVIDAAKGAGATRIGIVTDAMRGR